MYYKGEITHPVVIKHGRIIKIGQLKQLMYVCTTLVLSLVSYYSL